MLNTDKWTCRELVELMTAHGVRHAVISPGTRDTPLIMAIARCGEIECHSVVDERSGAFIALGMASVMGEPVALICTSGTALLNYAPAVTEAYYRHIPLIVVSADRPAEWIGQDDSQTINQPGVLDNIVLRSYSFNAAPSGDDERWMINRRINEAFLLATGNRPGPVHINVAIGEPVSGVEEVGKHRVRVIKSTGCLGEFPEEQARELARELSVSKVMVVAGFNRPDSRLNSALCRLAGMSNIVVLAERTSNLHSADFLDVVDETLFMAMSPAQIESLRPDIVISIGGSLISRPLKEQLRRWHPRHWYVGFENCVVDCFMSLERVVEAESSTFFSSLVSVMSENETTSGYSSMWRQVYSAAISKSASFGVSWSDMQAVRMIASCLPAECNLHVSNGMTLRYYMGAPLCVEVGRMDCNRGVSGIDGSTSTAVGASSLFQGDTILLTGDMSAQYDMSALASLSLANRFRMIVIANGDGGIFRVIKTTRELPELDSLIASKVNFPARQLADGFGLTFYEASSAEELERLLPEFMSDKNCRAMLVVHTDSVESARVASEFYKYMKYQK